MSHRGLLLTMTEPPGPMQGEFNAWYEDEHLPERLAITGFRSARRWVADVVPGKGKYLARFEGATPWTRRCLSKAVVFRRWACEQEGTADPHPLAKALLMIAADSPIKSLALPGALQTRYFTASVGTPRHIALAEPAWDGGGRTLPAAQPGWFMRLYRAYGA